MNKRSAMTIAAGLVLSLMVGAAAVAMGATGPDPIGGSDEAQAAQQPHMRTITRTVEVQRGSDDPAAPGAVATAATQSPSSSQESFGDDDRWDDHGDEDDDRWDDHGDEEDHDRWDDHGDEGDDDHGVDD